mgnify:FL=1
MTLVAVKQIEVNRYGGGRGKIVYCERGYRSREVDPSFVARLVSLEI